MREHETLIEIHRASLSLGTITPRLVQSATECIHRRQILKPLPRARDCCPTHCERTQLLFTRLGQPRLRHSSTCSDLPLRGTVPALPCSIHRLCRPRWGRQCPPVRGLPPVSQCGPGVALRPSARGRTRPLPSSPVRQHLCFRGSPSHLACFPIHSMICPVFFELRHRLLITTKTAPAPAATSPSPSGINRSLTAPVRGSSLPDGAGLADWSCGC